MDSGFGDQAVARALLRDFSKSDDRSAWVQILNSVLPYIGLWALMLWLTNPLLILPVSILAALFLVRIFVIQHDCGHNSLFSSTSKNDWVGSALSVITFTPLYNWRVLHNLHHATSGNLDRRDQGDIWMMTVKEYKQSSAWGKFRYRFYRHPIFLFVLGPGFYFLFRRRFPIQLAPHLKKARRNVYLTDIAILALYGAVAYLFGVGKLALIAVPIIFISASVGVWLFFVQHHFENAYWKRDEQWSHFEAGHRGSSYYDLPKWLHWFTADIAVHHIHHIDSKVPNYRLTECMGSHPALAPVEKLSLRNSFRLASLTLWDETEGKLVGYP